MATSLEVAERWQFSTAISQSERKVNSGVCQHNGTHIESSQNSRSQTKFQFAQTKIFVDHNGELPLRVYK